MSRTPVLVIAVATVAAFAGCNSRKVQERFGGGADPLAAKRAPAETGTVVITAPLPPGPVAVPEGIDFDAVEVDRIGPEGPVISVGTTGLAAQGAPEVIVHGVPSALQYAAEDMVFSTMGAIYMATPIGADSTIAVTVLPYLEDDGDADAADAHGEEPANTDDRDEPAANPVVLPTVRLHLSRSEGALAIVFPGPKATEGERLAAALASWDSGPAGSTTFESDPAIEAKISKAHGELRALAKRWSKGAPTGERLSVDAPFDAGESLLYLDVEVTRIEGETITGILVSQPSRPISGGVTLGSRVTVTLGETLDYQWTDAKGETHSGGVNELIDARDPS